MLILCKLKNWKRSHSNSTIDDFLLRLFINTVLNYDEYTFHKTCNISHIK